MSLKNEVQEFLDNAGLNHEFFGGDIYSDEERALAEVDLTAEEVDQHGGEGQGDEYWRVWSFTKDGETVYVKFDGSYASYSGSEYYQRFFVTPVEVLRTEYQPVK